MAKDKPLNTGIRKDAKKPVKAAKGQDNRPHMVRAREAAQATAHA